MSSLLKWLSPEEFVIACAKRPRSGPANDTMRLFPVLWRPVTGLSWRLDQIIHSSYFQTGLPSRALQALAQKVNCGAILAVYPDIHALAIGLSVATKLRLPLSIYLHDTIVEGAQGSRFESQARKIQTALFSGNHLFFSMSEGMAELLLRKYGIRTVPLPHCYNEIPSPPQPASLERGSGPRTALFSGNVYEINRPAVIRVAKAAVNAGYRIICTSATAAKIIIGGGLSAASVGVKSSPDRNEYLALLREQDALFVALAWPQEASIHRDELATIFPTKVPEYLGAARPILVHCPDDYFLASFFRRHQCGLVISERSEEALCRAWSTLGDDQNLALRLAANAHQAASYFNGEEISAVFKGHIEALIARS